MTQKIPSPLRKRIKDFLAARSAAKEATNKLNREKTALKKQLIDTVRELELPADAIIRSDGLDIRYDVTESTKIEPETVLDMYESGDLAREKLLDMLKVSKTDAKRILGEDVVLAIEVQEKGSRADIRIAETPIDNVEEYAIILPTELKMTRTVKPRRKVIGKRGSTSAKARRRVKRRIIK